MSYSLKTILWWEPVRNAVTVLTIGSSVVLVAASTAGSDLGFAHHARLSIARWTTALPNGTDGIVDASYIRRLDCVENQTWSTFRLKLVAAMEAPGLLGHDPSLVGDANRLLEPFDNQPREFFQRQGLEFHANLAGSDQQSRQIFCFPGYQAACLVRVLSLAAQVASGQPVRDFLEANAQYCASIFGKDAALEYMSSTSWPVRLLDFETHMTSCPDSAFTKRLAKTLPAGVETFDHFKLFFPQHNLKAGASYLHPGSVDPQGMSAACKGCAAAASSKRITIVSVDGGHCALWLEPAVTLRTLFPETVITKLASFKTASDCQALMGEATLKQEDLFINQKYDSSSILRAADVLVGQWIGECAKLRAHYMKPVIAYIGFLLLTDPSVGHYHAWSTPVEHYWDRFAYLNACDVHARSGGAAADGGPSCALVFEEPQLAEAAHWQTGQRRPSVRPLSLYVNALHEPHLATDEVLVINRARLVRDGIFSQALNAMRHPRYPHSFVNQRRGMSYSDMSTYRGVVLLPWDLNLVMFHDLYAMNLPMFLPDREGLHHVALTYFSRFMKNTAHAGQAFAEPMPGRGNPPHLFSPFQLEYVEARDYWLGFTEYLRAPSILHFASLPDLLLQAAELDGARVSNRMRAHNALCFRQSRAFWGRVLGVFERHQTYEGIPESSLSPDSFHAGGRLDRSQNLET
ncbi:unnamed protein product [Polarella glacialis]|uniref:Uncharacterized protein n=1 Tax=Polarella glacialis TaxID=89957 RepID=A0A813JAQ2_POLGL|nr:unnamed protein product [Polarella glacialis]